MIINNETDHSSEKRYLYDLHLHSTASDGQLTPSSLVKYAAQKGVTALALTDHDTIAGLNEASLTAAELNLLFIPGVEISVDSHYGEMHILGYGVLEREPLVGFLAMQNQNRLNRNLKIIEKLQEQGLDITYDEVVALASQSNADSASNMIVIGRPHIAAILIAKSYVANHNDAFNLYLKEGMPAYVEREKTPPDEAIAIIRASGGLAVLAHPFQLGIIAPTLMDQAVDALVKAGLEGIEALHSDHDKADQRFYSSLADKYGLLITGGSDFHGSRVTPDVEIGKGRNHNLKLYDRQIIEKLIERIEARHREVT